LYNKFRNLDNEKTNPRLRKEGKLEVMPGGLWFNRGFSCSDHQAETLKEFEIILCPVRLKNDTTANTTSEIKAE
jgi:hypothetical protein